MVDEGDLGDAAQSMTTEGLGSRSILAAQIATPKEGCLQGEGNRRRRGGSTNMPKMK